MDNKINFSQEVFPKDSFIQHITMKIQIQKSPLLSLTIHLKLNSAKNCLYFPLKLYINKSHCLNLLKIQCIIAKTYKISV